MSGNSNELQIGWVLVGRDDFFFRVIIFKIISMLALLHFLCTILESILCLGGGRRLLYQEYKMGGI